MISPKEFNEKMAASPQMANLKKTEQYLAEALGELMLYADELLGRPKEMQCINGMFGWATDQKWRMMILSKVMKYWHAGGKIICGECPQANTNCCDSEQCAMRLNMGMVRDAGTKEGIVALLSEVLFNNIRDDDDDDDVTIISLN